MRRPARRTLSRRQRSSRRPTPLPSPPVRRGPKGPPVRRIPKNPPKPRPIRGGPKTPPKPRPTGSGPYRGRVAKRVKETLTPIKKTPSNTGTSTKTAQLQRFNAAQRAAVSRPATGGQAKKASPAELARIRAGNAARNKAPTQTISQKVPAGVRRATPADLAKFRNKAPATPTRRPRRSRGLAGPLRRRRARMGRG